MSAVHVGLALLVAVIWGVAFVATRIGLDSFSAPQLTAVRFLVASVPVVLVPRPRIGWAPFVAIGLALYTGQFLFQFFGIASGMPPGLASVIVQTQAFFTVIFAALALREMPTRREISGVAAAAAGVLVIAVTLGRDTTLASFLLTLTAAVSWGVGNVLIKRVGRVETLHLMIWLAIVPPLPALAVSVVLDGPLALVSAIGRASWPSIAAAIYLGLVATVLAYAVWGDLLRRYSAAMVAPFALLVPFVGAASSRVVFGERFGVVRLAGMALVLAGLAIIVWRPRAIESSREIAARPR
jgi:O-acetylserine/cysteine efflux transporter